MVARVVRQRRQARVFAIGRSSERTEEAARAGIIIRGREVRRSVIRRHLSGPFTDRYLRTVFSSGGQFAPVWSQKLGKASWIRSGNGGSEFAAAEKE